MDSNFKCPNCKERTEIYREPYDLPILDKAEGEIKENDIDKVTLMICGKCTAIIGVYK